MKITTSLAIFAAIFLTYNLGCGLLVNHPDYNAVQCQSVTDKLFSGNNQTVQGQIQNSISDVIGGSAALFIIATVIFPNPYTIFAPIALVILSYTVLPANIFFIFGIDGVFGNALTTLLTVLFALSVAGWFKGTDT